MYKIVTSYTFPPTENHAIKRNASNTKMSRTGN